MSSLPSHGPISCRRCFGGVDGDTLEVGAWRAVNDPGAWGSSTPKVLVLGFSKGFTQANAYRAGRFEDVPFKRMRDRLAASLRLLGLADDDIHIDRRFVPTESDYGFGSLVRCSLSRLNPANGKRECTGAVMPKAFTEEIRAVVRRCAETYLTALPPSVEIVVMLGTTSAYIQACRALIRSLYGAAFSDINGAAYRTGGVIWVHVAHPSGMNGFHKNWMAADASDASGMKCLEAQQALALVRKVSKAA